MRAEDLKCWLRGIEAEEKAEREGEEGFEGKGDTWRKLVRLIQHVWDTGEIPTQLLRIIIVLIPKGNSGDYRGIGLLEVIWKVVERILDARLSTIELHDCLHGFRAGRGCGTGIMEAKLAQKLAFIEQVPLYGIFIDLHKAYDAMDRGECLKILRDAGTGEKALCLISRFWKQSVMVCRAGGRYGRVFRARRGVTQGGPLSPTIFNIMVDAVVREWLQNTLTPEDAKLAIQDVRKLMAAFYADDGLVASRDPVRLQQAFNELTALFERVGLKTNAKKTEVVVFLPGKIRNRLSPEGYAARMDAEIWSELRGEPVGRRVQCPKCDATLRAGSLRSHLETQHDVFEVLAPRVDVAPAPPATYRVQSEAWRSGYACPIPECPYRHARDSYALRAHFRHRHPRDEVVIDGERFHRCESCGMQISNMVAGSARHLATAACRRMTAMKTQHRCAEEGARAASQKFYAYGQELRSVERFKYLGRILSSSDSDMPAVRKNLAKAKAVWRRISTVIAKESVPAVIAGMFFRVVVEAVLLYGSETWALPPTAMRCLNGFQVEAARRLTGMMPRKRGTTWVYPKTAEVMKAARLRPIEESVRRRRNTVLRAIEGRRALVECRGAERRRGSPSRQYWWEQDFTLEAEEEESPPSPLGFGPGAPRGVSGHGALRRRLWRELQEG